MMAAGLVACERGIVAGVCGPGDTVVCYTGPPSTKDVGACRSGTRSCVADGTGYASTCVGEVLPASEVCATPEDDDCDGVANEEGDDCACSPGEVTPCYTGPDGTEGIGLCVAGTGTCLPGGLGFGPCVGEVTPAPEDCSTPVDDDCNGLVNEAAAGCVCEPGEVAACYDGPAGTEGVGDCVGGMQVCEADGIGFGTCTGSVTPTTESCDASGDEDCNGVANESGAGCVCVPGSVESCYSGPPGTEGVGVCKGGMHTCGPSGTDWGPCVGEVLPTAEDPTSLANEDCVVNKGELVWWKALPNGFPYPDLYVQDWTTEQLSTDPAGGVLTELRFSGSVDYGLGSWTAPPGGWADAVVHWQTDGVPDWGFVLPRPGAVAVAPSGELGIVHDVTQVETLYGFVADPGLGNAVLVRFSAAGQPTSAVPFSLTAPLAAVGNPGSFAVDLADNGNLAFAQWFGTDLDPVCRVGEVGVVGPAGLAWRQFIVQTDQCALFPQQTVMSVAAGALGDVFLHTGSWTSSSFDFGAGPLSYPPSVILAMYDAQGTLQFATREAGDSVWRGVQAASDGTFRVYGAWGGLSGNDIPPGRQIVTWAADGTITETQPGYEHWRYSSTGILTAIEVPYPPAPSVDFGGGPTAANPLGVTAYVAQFAADGSFSYSRGLGFAIDPAYGHRRILSTAPDGSVYLLFTTDGDLDLGDGPMAFASTTVILAKLAP